MTNEKRKCSRERHGRMAMKVLVGFWAACVTSALLSAPLARAGSFSGTASITGTGIECIGGTSDGGSGFASASVGPASCTFVNPFFGGSQGTSGLSASGSWITGDFSASAGAFSNPGSGSQTAIASDTFSDSGVVTLPSGMTSASVTFGLTGLSGTVSGGPVPTGPGGFAAEDVITLQMSAGGSSGTSGTSSACLQVPFGFCPGIGPALPAFGPGSLAPITLTVHNGDTLQLSLSVEAEATANGISAPETANAEITVDPLFLKLPAGATFDSGITGFLSGSGTSVPEPSSVLFFAAGLLGLCMLGRYRTRRGWSVAPHD